MDIDDEIEEMQKPPRNAWGGFKTEQQWLALQEGFQRQQRRYELNPASVGSNLQRHRTQNDPS